MNIVKRVAKAIKVWCGNEHGQLDRVVFWVFVIGIFIDGLDFNWDKVALDGLIIIYARDAYKAKCKS